MAFEVVKKLGRVDGTLIYHDINISESKVFIGIKKNFNKPLIIHNDELVPMYNDNINYIKLSLNEYKDEHIYFIIGGSLDIEFYEFILKNIKK